MRSRVEWLAVARMVVAGGCVVAPHQAGRLWAGTDDRDVGAIIRSFAIRDFVLGLGVLLAARRGRPVRGWVEAGLLSDATDVVFTVLGRGTPSRRLIVATGVTPFVLGGMLALQEVRTGAEGEGG